MIDDSDLPTRPSWYLCNNGYAWELREDCTWYLHGVPMTDDEALQVMPFQRLEVADDE